jgi:protein-L-isoaspartate(D-aspartate) O-methyltransferase
MDLYEQQRSAMVERQIEERGVRDPRVLAAMRAVPRHEFIDVARRAYAYDDGPLPIGLGQTISQPYIVAWMTELLGLKPDDHVLEIGTGCGYQTAVLAKVARYVYSIERMADLSAQAALTLSRIGITNVSLRVGDGFDGWPLHAPYPAILCAAAPAEIPEALTRQLAEGGRMVLPVGPSRAQDMVRLTKANGRIERESLGAVAFVPMILGQA